MPLAALTPVLNDLLHKSQQSSDGQGDYSSMVRLSGEEYRPRQASTEGLASPVTEYEELDNKARVERQDSFLKRFSTRYGYRGMGNLGRPAKRNLRAAIDKEEPIKCRYLPMRRLLHACNYFVISTDENFLFYWLVFLNLFILYNLWFPIARQAFEPLQREYAKTWQTLDYLADIVYVLDIGMQLRTGYLEQGLLVYNRQKLALNYVRSYRFIFDIVSLTPLELFQLKFGSLPLLRCPRFLKVYRTFQLYYLQESRTVYPNTYRVVNLFHILLLLAHWLASFYFMVSKAEDFTGYWSYPAPNGNFSQLTKMYFRCLYWSTLTLTTIGDLPPPETNWHYVFLISVHLFAVFVIAIIVGQVGNVITNRNASRLEFERLLDGAKQYMRTHNVPAEMQRRVQRWYDYSWSSGASDVHSIKLLPDKLKTELALHVNLGTLKKVTIFQECQPEFLHDLVLKMRAYIFTPGDVICRKGEVAREMFIIADGVLEVLNESNEVLSRLGSGDFFGEIGILNIDGANRRTADVRSVGYSELFSLSKEDVLEAMRDYPEAEKKLYEYAQNRLGFERARREASQKMKSAFNTLAAIASAITQERSSTPKNSSSPTHLDSQIKNACNDEKSVSEKESSLKDLRCSIQVNNEQQQYLMLNYHRNKSHFQNTSISSDLTTTIEMLINEKL
ncbi:unnamed protein product, partial [Didymodactylos carnosus]